MIGMYRLQLPPDARWTEWRDLAIAPKEPYIFSIRFSGETPDAERMAWMLKHIERPIWPSR